MFERLSVMQDHKDRCAYTLHIYLYVQDLAWAVKNVVVILARISYTAQASPPPLPTPPEIKIWSGLGTLSFSLGKIIPHPPMKIWSGLRTLSFINTPLPQWLMWRELVCGDIHSLWQNISTFCCPAYCHRSTRIFLSTSKWLKGVQ